MNHESNKRNLLDDVFAQPELETFRAQLLDDTLRMAGKQHRSRNTRRAASVLTVLIFIGALIWRMVPPRSVDAPLVASCPVVHTKPFSQIFRTGPLGTDRDFSNTSSVTVVHTTDQSGKFGLIHDDDLLAFAYPRPAVLVRTGPESQKLIFVNSGN